MRRTNRPEQRYAGKNINGINTQHKMNVYLERLQNKGIDTKTIAQTAFDEAKRELEVRERCYPKWVQEGKLSRTDAEVRMKGIIAVCALLADFPGVTANTLQDLSAWKPF